MSTSPLIDLDALEAALAGQPDRLRKAATQLHDMADVLEAEADELAPPAVKRTASKATAGKTSRPRQVPAASKRKRTDARDLHGRPLPDPDRPSSADKNGDAHPRRDAFGRRLDP